MRRTPAGADLGWTVQRIVSGKKTQYGGGGNRRSSAFPPNTAPISGPTLGAALPIGTLSVLKVVNIRIRTKNRTALINQGSMVRNGFISLTLLL